MWIKALLKRHTTPLMPPLNARIIVTLEVGKEYKAIGLFLLFQ
ncbi:hypothetical protein [Bartonella sp. AU16XJBT]|nr:hypothetical protein [Bartonella sp. AU16XJBT]